MLPKRQQKWKIGKKCTVNVAKKATVTGPGIIELNTDNNPVEPLDLRLHDNKQNVLQKYFCQQSFLFFEYC